MISQALIPNILKGSALQSRDPAQSASRLVQDNALAIGAGVFLLTLVSQIAIPLAFSPVPLTGQTFGVTLIALLWGRARGVAVVSIYLALGVFGFPVFALAKSGMLFGPTAGYLMGMLIATFAMGALADRGWTKTFAKTLVTASLGSVITFVSGLFILAVFIPHDSLLSAGLIPFLPGEIIKLLAACWLVSHPWTQRHN